MLMYIGRKYICFDIKPSFSNVFETVYNVFLSENRFTATWISSYPITMQNGYLEMFCVFWIDDGDYFLRIPPNGRYILPGFFWADYPLAHMVSTIFWAWACRIISLFRPQWRNVEANLITSTDRAANRLWNTSHSFFVNSNQSPHPFCMFKYYVSIHSGYLQ